MANLQKESRLTLVSFTKKKGGHQYAIYKCDCGKEKEFLCKNVERGYSKSCGCLRVEATRLRRIKNGLSNHPLRYIYDAIKRRCYNKNAKEYKYYGLAGITMCDEWRNDFNKFYEWAIENGWQKGLHIDKDINGGRVYSPDNCVIVTPKRNSNNRSNNRYIEIDGVVKSLSEWADHCNLPYKVLEHRLNLLGWDAPKAITTPKLLPNESRKRKNIS